MSNFVSLTLESRETTGKETNKKLRKIGYLPAVFYGHDYPEGLPVKLKERSLVMQLRHSHWETLRIDATMPDGRVEMALIRDLQRDPLTDHILHVDFYQMLKGQKVRIAVPVVLINKESCVGVKAGGALEVVAREVEIEVLPREIPDAIEVDVAQLQLGKSISAKQCALPESASLLTDPNEVLVLVVEPRVEEEAAPGASGSMEVEVVQKGKAKEE
jgi:large subunit ribosomal protein L25